MTRVRNATTPPDSRLSASQHVSRSLSLPTPHPRCPRPCGRTGSNPFIASPLHPFRPGRQNQGETEIEPDVLPSTAPVRHPRSSPTGGCPPQKLVTAPAPAPAPAPLASGAGAAIAAAAAAAASAKPRAPPRCPCPPLPGAETPSTLVLAWLLRVVCSCRSRLRR